MIISSFHLTGMDLNGAWQQIQHAERDLKTGPGLHACNLRSVSG